MSEYDVLINKYDALNAGYDQLYPVTKIKNVDGLDTALQNKAPAGYGLGANSKVVSDWNNEKTNGWVRDGSGTEDKHSPFVGLFSVGLISEYTSDGDTFQLAFARNQFAKTRTYIKFRAYNSDDDVWGEWEWVNPPMELGKEYRTTERYLGKPVYAMAVDFGNLPNATYKEITVSGVSYPDKVVSVFGYTSDSKTIPTFSYGWSSISTISDAIALDANAYPDSGLKINVTTQRNRSSATAVIIVKYTKSTD